MLPGTGLYITWYRSICYLVQVYMFPGPGLYVTWDTRLPITWDPRLPVTSDTLLFLRSLRRMDGELKN